MRRMGKFFLPFFSLVTFLFSFSPWFILLARTPKGQIFSGIHWWDSDYFVYLSFVENGVRGFLNERFLMNSITSYPAWIHGIYTLSGYLFGHLIGIHSISIYALDRFILGLIFLFLLTYLYKSIFKSVFWTFIALVFIFWIPGFPTTYNVHSSMFSQYLSWIQQLNILTRATGLPHYLFGFIFIIPAVWIFVSYRGFSLKKLIILSLLTQCFTYANPVNSLIFYATLAVFVFLSILTTILQNTVKGKKDFLSLPKSVIEDGLVALLLFLLNLPLLLYYRMILSNYPWGEISNVFKFFVGNSRISLLELFLSLGPLVLFSFTGIIVCSWRMIKSKSPDRWHLFCISWVVAQSGLFLYANSFGIEQYRFLQGLYYIPMGILAVEAVRFFAHLFEQFFPIHVSSRLWVCIFTVFSFLVTLPTLYLSFGQSLYTYSNLSYFQTIYFPTVKQFEAYSYLERNTPFAATVLALAEASSHIPAFSGNANKLDFIDKTKISKSQFFSNSISPEEASSYLKNSTISYVWVGWEERNTGFQVNKYPYLQQIFRNSEVEIYKVGGKIESKKE